MANPFKEAENKKKKAPGSKQEPVVEEKPVVVEETPVEPEKPVETLSEPIVEEKEPKPAKRVEKKAEKKEPAPAAKATDLFAGLKSEKPANLKTYAFYLSDENVDKLKAMAAKKGMSTSKLLDYILSEVL